MTSPKTPSLLFISCRTPWNSAAPAACIDVLMTAAVFDQNVSLLLLGAGIRQLLRQQDGSGLQQKTLAKMFPALELYDVHNVYVEAEAMRAEALTPADLLIPVTSLETTGIRQLLADSTTTLVF